MTAHWVEIGGTPLAPCLELDKKVMTRKTLKYLTKLLDRLHGIGRRYNNSMESRSIMVLANGMVHKLREELKNDGALMFNLIFLAYLNIGGEYFCLLFPLFAFVCTLCFGVLCGLHILVLCWLCYFKNK